MELAGMIAKFNGVAKGAGTTSYGAQIIVRAQNSEEAKEMAITKFRQAAKQAKRPDWPIVESEIISEN